MTELDPIEQEIIVQTEKAIAALEALVKESELTADEMRALMVSVEAAQEAIDDLEGKEVRIGVIWEDNGGVDALEAAVAAYKELRGISPDWPLDQAKIDEIAASLYTVADAEEKVAADAVQAQVALDALDGKKISVNTVFSQEGAPPVLEGATGGGPTVAEYEQMVNGAKRATEAVDALGAALDDKAPKVSALARMMQELGLDESDLAEMSGIASAAFLRQAETADSKKDKLGALAAAANMVAQAERGLKVSARDVAAEMEAAGGLASQTALKQWQLKAAIEEVGLSEEQAATLHRLSGSALFDEGQEAQTKADKLRALANSIDFVKSSDASFRGVLLNTAQAQRDSGTAADRLLILMQQMAVQSSATAGAVAAAGGAAGGAAAGFRIWGTGIRLTGYGIHWLIAGSLEILAVVVPALIAAADAAAVMAQGATWVADRMQAVYTTSEATAQMLHQTAGQAIGLSGALQKAQDAATPGVYQLFGSAINAVKDSFGGFFQQGVLVVQMLDRFAASINVQLRGALGGQLQGLIKGMVFDLQGLGQVFGNLGHAILNIVSSMPGLAAVLLSILSAFTRLIEVITSLGMHLSLFGVNAITAFMALEELGRWMGLVLRLIGPLVNSFGLLLTTIGPAGGIIRSLGVSIGVVGAEMEVAGAMTKTFWGTLKMLFTTPVGWALLAGAAIAFLIIKFHAVQSAAQQFTSTMTNALNNAPIAQGIGLAIQDIGQLQTKLDNTNPTIMQAGVNFRFVGGSIAQANPAYVAYQTALSQVESKLVGALGISVTYGKQQYDLVTSIGLAAAAGVKMNDILDKNGKLSATAVQMINNLIAGYAAMGAAGGTLNADIQAINVSTLTQQTRVQQLNQAWDQFIQNITGGTGALAGLQTSLTTMGNITTNATTQISAFNQQAQGQRLSVDQIAQALKSFSGTSAQVWQNYNQLVTQANTVTDWLRTAASQGAVTSTQYANSIKGVVSYLLPYAKYSATAAAEASGLAFQVTGTTMNYKQLQQWVGNVNGAQQTLNSTVQSATQYMANLNGVAATLSSTLSSAVANAVTQGTVNMAGIAKAAQAFNQQLQTGYYSTPPFTAALRGMVGQLLAAHTPAADVTSIIDLLATRAGATKGQIATLNGEIQALITSLNNVPRNVQSTVTVTTITNAVQQPGSSYVPPVGKPLYQKGTLVPGGYGGGDIVPAMLEPGEAVVPKHLVKDIAPFLSMHKVPGFAAGGRVGDGDHDRDDRRPPHHRHHPPPHHRPPHHHHGGGSGGISGGGIHNQPPPRRPPVPLTPMEKVIELWAREIWQMDLQQYGKHSPIAAREMAALFGATAGGRGGMWNNPQFRFLEHAERGDMGKYEMRDVAYWKDLMARHALSAAHQKQIKALEQQIKKAGRNDNLHRAAHLETGYRHLESEYAKLTREIKAAERDRDKHPDKDDALVRRLLRERAKIAAEGHSLTSQINTIKSNYALVHRDEKLLKSLQSPKGADQRKYHQLTDMINSLLEGMGYSRGGLIPFGHYDRGGHLPQGLSLALNTTGRPEPVGHGPQVIHVHVEVGGKEIANAQVPYQVAAVNRYGYRNSGKPVGLLRPS